MHVWVLHMLCQWCPEVGIRSLEAGVTGGCGPLSIGVWNPDPLEEQQEILTFQPTLHPQWWLALIANLIRFVTSIRYYSRWAFEGLSRKEELSEKTLPQCGQYLQMAFQLSMQMEAKALLLFCPSSLLAHLFICSIAVAIILHWHQSQLLGIEDHGSLESSSLQFQTGTINISILFDPSGYWVLSLSSRQAAIVGPPSLFSISVMANLGYIWTNRSTNIWASLWEILLIGLFKVGRHTLNLGHIFWQHTI